MPAHAFERMLAGLPSLRELLAPPGTTGPQFFAVCSCGWQTLGFTRPNLARAAIDEHIREREAMARRPARRQ